MLYQQKHPKINQKKKDKIMKIMKIIIYRVLLGHVYMTTHIDCKLISVFNVKLTS